MSHANSGPGHEHAINHIKRVECIRVDRSLLMKVHGKYDNRSFEEILLIVLCKCTECIGVRT